MNITIKPWNPGDGGLICLPLRSNIPDASKHHRTAANTYRQASGPEKQK